MTVWLEESGLDPKDAFRLDCKPDSSNMHYESLYSGDVATYRRNLETIGLGPHQAVEWTDNRSRTMKEKRAKLVRYFKGVAADTVVVQVNRRQPVSDTDLGVEEYIGLELEGCIEGTPPPELTLELHLTQRTAQYNRMLQEDPHNMPLWLEFIAFQDEVLLWGGGADVQRRKRQVAERKLAIFERALESNPLSVDLLVGHMQQVEEVWEVERVVKRWKDLVFRQPHRPRLWLHYLQFCQSHFAAFTVSSLTALFTKCLSTLTAIQEGTLKSHKPDATTPQYMLAIFVLFCSFLRQAGYSEKAIACFQALVEFNLCCPAELDAEDLPSKARLEFLGTYWDSGVPRFGELGTQGWSNWISVTQDGGASRPSLGVLDSGLCMKTVEESAGEVDPEVALVSGLSLPEAWLQLECHRAKEECFPWKALEGESEEECADPERMVLFDDVSPCMFRLSDPSLQLQLVLAFLHFLGAPSPTPPPLTLIPHHLSSSLESWSEVVLTDTIACLLSTPEITQANQYPHNLLGMGCCSENTKHLTDMPSTSEYFTMVVQRAPSACNFIANVCNQALALFSSAAAQTTLAQVWVHFELSLLVKDLSSGKPDKEVRGRVRVVQRLVKALLRLESQRNALPLWNCCALLEYLLGNSAEAIKLFQAVLSQHPNSEKLTLLYHSFCECLLGLLPPLSTPSHSPPHTTLALHTTMCLVEGKYQPMEETQIPPSRILKCRSKFEQTSSVNTPVEWVACHAYFEYLSHGISSACKVFEEWTSTLTTRLQSAPPQEADTLLSRLELTYRLHYHLLLHHSRMHPIQPSLLRSTIEQALSFLPNHGWFLAAYIDCEQQSFISGRLRRYFDAQAPKAETAVPWLFAIHAELRRHQRLREFSGEEAERELVTGVVHRVRALLSRATESERGRHCPLLWRISMAFEVMRACYTDSLVPRPLPDFILQPWRKIGRRPGIKTTQNYVTDRKWWTRFVLQDYKIKSGNGLGTRLLY